MLSLRNSEGQIMERKKILIIGMFDSVHLARWLSQFSDQNIDFILFPSKKFKYVHSDLVTLTLLENIARYKFAKPYICFKYIGYLDFLAQLLFKLLRRNVRRLLLEKVLKKNQFDFVHAIEIQGAGYLYNSLPKNVSGENTLILTNYGSDIIFFKNKEEHRIKIKSVLQQAKLYSGECQRDYEIALSLGFVGKFLPCVPNAGGFKNELFDLNVLPSDERDLIVAKCYGGIFGLGGLIIDALGVFLVDNPKTKVLIHSVTDDLIQKSLDIKTCFPGQIEIYSVRNKLTRQSLLEFLSKARLYIGASSSDGISTSFLEALCLGAYPIQTNTACVDEWINLGFNGSIVSTSKIEILNALNVNYFQSDLNEKRIENLTLAKKYLDYNFIKNKSLEFYGLI